MSGDILNVLDIAGGTDVGSKRQRNEDSYTMLVPGVGTSERSVGAFLIVADGMGGLGGGDTASQAGIDQAVRTFYGGQNPSQDLAARVMETLESANGFVRDQAIRAQLMRIGSTAAGVAVRPSGEAVIFNVGDCRVYRVRGGQITRLSRDQSVMERQIEAGMITREEAKASRNSMVTAFLGQPFPLTPVLIQDQVQPGDVYLICSDGLWSLVDDEELNRIIKTSPADAAVKKFIKLAISRGGNDNITAIVARFAPPPRPSGSFALPLIVSLVVIGIMIGLLALTGGRGEAGSDLTLTPEQSVTASSDTNTTAAASKTPEVLATAEPSRTPSKTNTATVTEVPSKTFTATASSTLPPSLTSTFTATATQTFTRTASSTVEPSKTFTQTHTATFTVTVAASPTNTATAAATKTPSASATVAPSQTPAPSATPSLTPSRTASQTATATVGSSPTATITLSPTVSQTPSKTLTPSPTKLIISVTHAATLPAVRAP
ncbi:MAG: protein phosphatase 2C domain-containing protein [Anaerolinea sp.]|nr:protein phosphatase 2C domain-containing protein [Anaerolinea sp.]